MNNGKLTLVVLAAVMCVSLVYANLLTNPGFESGFASGWNNWNSGSIMDAGWDPHSGTNTARMWWGAGVYQDFSAVAGSNYQVSAQTYYQSSDPIINGVTGVVGTVKLEWYDSGDNPLGTPWEYDFGTAINATPDTWTEAASGSQEAPANTSYGRLLCQIDNDGGGAGSAFFDDASVIGVIPEPVSAGLLLIGIVSLYAFRSRKQN